MKRGITVLFFAGLFFLACLAYPASAFGQELQFRVTVQVANIRLEPTTSSSVIGQAKAGTVLKVIEAGEWVRVSLPAEGGFEKVGYILARLGNLETVQKAQVQSTPRVASLAREDPAQATPVQPEVNSKSPSSPEVKDPGSASQTVRQVQSQKRTGPGKFGVGINLAATPGGAVPSILYDLTDRVTLNAALGLYTGVTGVTGELLYRFPRPPKNSPSEVSFEPYVGGGLIFVSVNPGFGISKSYTGFIGSGGTFLTFRKIPRWRFSGDINFVQFNVERISVAGLGIRLGFHYFF